MDNSQTLSFLQLERSQQELSGQEAFGRMIGGLAVCLVLILVGVAVLKRVNRFVGVSTEKRLRVKERLPVSNKTSLVLVELGGREILISVGSETVTEITGAGSQLEAPVSASVVKPELVASQASSSQDIFNQSQPADRDPSNHNDLIVKDDDSLIGNAPHGTGEADTPILLNRPVDQALDQSAFKGKLLANQLIITNPYRQ